MSFPRYEKYKQSGIPWIGSLPAHWETVPYKHLVDIQNGADHKHIEQAEGYPVIGSGGVFAYAAEFMYDGDSVLLGRKGTIDKPLFVSGRFWTVDTMYWTKIAQDANPRFSYYTALTIPFDYYSTNTALPSMTKSVLHAHLIARPPKLEQAAIATFLDHETAKIDALVEVQKRLIELLKEKRQAVISHAVTKGLNPNAPMKDSGVEWLGEVPAHWSTCALRRVIAAIEQGWSPECDASPADDQSWGVLKAGCVNRGVFDPSENKSLPQALTPVQEYEVRTGDVLVSRASGSPELVGSTALVGETRGKLMLSDKIFRVHLTPHMASAFFVWAMNGKALRDQIERALSGGNGLANNLPQSAMLAFFVAVPPIDEQLMVASAVERAAGKCDALIAQADSAVGLLQERRTALISAAVTGKIDVRRAAAEASV